MSGGDPLDEFFWRADEAMPGLGEVVSAPPAPAVATEAVSEWLTFGLGDERYAIAIEHVREVLKAPPITEVPRSPAHVLGVIMVRGEVIAIFDPRRRLGLPPAPAPARSPRVLVCDAGDGARGLLVDSVGKVLKLGASEREPRPGGVGGEAADLIQAIGRDGSELFLLIDGPGLLRDGSSLTESL